MSEYLAELEEDLDAELFERSGKRLGTPPTLTWAGIERRQLLENPPQVIRLGAPAHLLTTFIPKAIQTYRRLYPQSPFRFELHVVPDSKHAVKLFRQANIDVVFGAAMDLPDTDRPADVTATSAPWSPPRLLVSDDQRVLGFLLMSTDRQRALLAGKTFITVGATDIRGALPAGVLARDCKIVAADTPEVAVAMIRSGVGSYAVLGVHAATVDHFRNTGEIQYCTLDATVPHTTWVAESPHRAEIDRFLADATDRVEDDLGAGPGRPRFGPLPAFSRERYCTPKFLYYIVAHENQNGINPAVTVADLTDPLRPKWHSEIWWPGGDFVSGGEVNGIPKYTYRGGMLNDVGVVYSVRATLFGQLSLSLECDKYLAAGGEAHFSFSARFDGYFGDERRGVWYGTWTGMPTEDTPTRGKAWVQNYNYGILMADAPLTANQIAHVSQAITRFCIAEALIDADMIDRTMQRTNSLDMPPPEVVAVLKRDADPR